MDYNESLNDIIKLVEDVLLYEKRLLTHKNYQDSYEHIEIALENIKIDKDCTYVDNKGIKDV